MFQFSDGSLIEGQSDLIKTLNQYNSIKNAYIEDVGAYDLNRYNTNDCKIDTITFECGTTNSNYYNYNTNSTVHNFKYTNKTDKSISITITTYSPRAYSFIYKIGYNREYYDYMGNRLNSCYLTLNAGETITMYLSSSGDYLLPIDSYLSVFIKF